MDFPILYSLDEAARKIDPSGRIITGRSLKREHLAHRLTVTRVAGKPFIRHEDLIEYLDLCRCPERTKAPDWSSTDRTANTEPGQSAGSANMCGTPSIMSAGKSASVQRALASAEKLKRKTGSPKSSATAAEPPSRRAAEPERRGPRGPDTFPIAEALALYAEGHGPTLRRADCVANDIEHLVAWWGDVPVANITGAACRRYVKERLESIVAGKIARRSAAEARAETAGRTLPPAREAGASNATPRQELAVMKAAVRWCVAEGHLTTAPPVTLPERPAARERWLTRPEVAKLARTARAEGGRLHLPLFILLAVYTGARSTAILGLQWQPNTSGGWVDLNKGVIDFRPMGAGQTNKRRSVVPIPRRLLTFLRLARGRTRQYVLEYRGRPIGDVKKGLMGAARRGGVGHVHPHMLRHTAVTWLVRANVPLWQVVGWVGMTVSMIENVYGHHAPDQYAAIEKAQR